MSMNTVQCPSCKGSLIITGIEDDPRVVKTVEWRCLGCSRTGAIVVDDLRKHQKMASAPITMVIACLACGREHVCAQPRSGNEPCEALTKTHRCRFCGLEWTPAPVNTIGIAFKPRQFE